MDVDGLTFACAMTVEERIARRLGRTALVGLGASRGVPEGRLVSFGIAGALAADLPIGTVIDATRVVGHSDIAPGRKTDPGPAFDWLRLAQLIKPRRWAKL